MQSRRKLIIVLVSVVLGILFVVACVLLALGFKEFRKEEGRLDASRAELQRLYGHDPFPSVHNVRTERANLADMEEQLANLFATLKSGQIESVEQSPPKFSAEFWETRKQLYEKARKDGVISGGGPKDSFGFGFERYMQGAMPLPQDVPRLTQQLQIVETLCKSLFNARITELSGIGREEFEGETSGGGAAAQPEPTAGGRTRRGPKVTAVSASLNTVNRAAGIIPSDRSYTAWHFVFRFTAKEKALLDVLNGFARAPVFIVVTDMTLSSPEQGLARQSEAGAETTPARRGGSAMKAPEAPAEGGRTTIVCGHDLPLTVAMGIDVFQFAAPSASSPGSSGEGAQ